MASSSCFSSSSSLVSSGYSTPLTNQSFKLISHRQALKITAQSFRDEGRWSSEIVEANLRVLKGRIEQIKMKERLERCCRCEYGWNYQPGYDNKIKKQAELTQFFDLVSLVFGTLGLTGLSGTLILCIISIIVHLNH